MDNPAEKSIAIFAPAALFLALMLECRDSMLVITRWLIIPIAEAFAGRSLLHPLQRRLESAPAPVQRRPGLRAATLAAGSLHRYGRAVLQPRASLARRRYGTRYGDGDAESVST